ncbi:hypothetical protein D3C71_1727890 [compost metagenome]
MAPTAAALPTANNATGAAWVMLHPNPNTRAGTARIPPPAPVKPSTNPITTPNRLASNIRSSQSTLDTRVSHSRPLSIPFQ